MTILYALFVLLVAVVGITIKSLYDLIYSYTLLQSCLEVEHHCIVYRKPFISIE